MSTRPAVKPSVLRRGAVLTASVLSAGALVTFTGAAGAAPQPTVSQVQKTISKLSSQMDQAVQRYDQAAQQLASARQRLRLINREVSTDQAKFQSMRTQIAAIASTAYESGNMSNVGALLTSSNPQAVLAQASVLMQLSTDRSAQIGQFIAAARQLQGAHETASRTEKGVAALDKQRRARKNAIGKTLAKKKSLLATLTAQQQAATTIGGVGISGTYTGPTATQAEGAVKFAFMVKNAVTPYVYGGTGPPGPNGGYDCSGLVRAAWAAAGISIPRDTFSQVATLTAVSLSNLELGDLIFFDGDSHVAIYVGGGDIIDAPQQGQNVEEVSLSSSWYAANEDSAARP